MQQESSVDTTPLAILAQAIQERRMVAVTYNGTQLDLCPHQLIMRHQSVYLRALNPLKGRRHDEEPSLGNFNIAGLSNISVTEQPFEPLPAFEGKPEREDDRSLISVLDD